MSYLMQQDVASGVPLAAPTEPSWKTDRFLLATKIAVPPARSDVVARARLIAKLPPSRERRLTLLAAPAGFGKTTLLTSWIHQGNVPIAWVTLDAGDDDLTRFWTYVVAALDSHCPGVRQDALALQASQPPPIDVVLTTLINRLAARCPKAVLVLDDYHLISKPAVHSSVAFFLDHLPEQIHLVIATRADPPLPLARLRTRGQLSEIRAADLRFTTEEAAEFLTRVVGQDLRAEDVAALDARTEGWIAGLQLAALSMQGRRDIPRFIQAFTGSHRYVVDYLVQEVLARQPENVQTFLLQTSILDRLTGSLCEAVTGQEDGEATLERLEQANLFVVPLDDERHWYRYHQLFAELLRHRLQKAPVTPLPELHRRASAWYERAGLGRAAIGHALAAGDVERAADLIERKATPLIKRGEIATVRRWVEALPDNQVRARIRLILLRAWFSFFDGQYDRAEMVLQEIEQTLPKDAQPVRPRSGEGSTESSGPGEPRRLTATEASGEIASIRAFIALNRENPDRAIELARQALTQLPEDSDLRGLMTWNLGVGYWLTGDVEAARAAVGQANQLSQATGHLYAAFLASDNVAQIQMAQGQLRHAEQTYRRALDFATGRDEPLPAAGLAYVGLGDLHREWNDLDAATDFLREGIRQGEQLGHVGVTLRGKLNLALVQQARGDHAAALVEFQDGVDAVRHLAAPSRATSKIAALRARLFLAEGNLAAVFRWAQESGLGVGDTPNHLREAEHLTLARALLAQGKPADALALLDRLLSAAETQGRLGSVIAINALRALAQQAQGDGLKATDTLAQALALAEPEGYVRLFVDEGAPMAALLTDLSLQERIGPGEVSEAYVTSLLSALGVEVATPASRSAESALAPRAVNTASAQPESLSEREIEILGLIAIGYSNREIADRLVLAVSTVKWYVNIIFGKLQVDSRTKVVARARALSLISD